MITALNLKKSMEAVLAAELSSDSETLDIVFLEGALGLDNPRHP